MLSVKNSINTMLNSPVRQIRARVELLEGSTLLNSFTYRDALISFDIQRVGEESKFFGFGICQRLNIHLRDKDRQINITTANTIDVAFGVGSDYIYPYPAFFVKEVHRDEKTNELSITCYDKIYDTINTPITELNFSTPYTIRTFLDAVSAYLNLPLKIVGVGSNETCFDLNYESGANFTGDEKIRDVLNSIAEATQTIYYISNQWELTFKRLDVNGEPVLHIGKDKYIDLDSGTNRRLVGICSTTELGDNVESKLSVSGSIQYVRNNPFWDLRDDLGTLLDNAVSAICGLTINQFSSSWRGNFLLEIGDKISFTTKDDNTVYSFVLDDTVEYNGILNEKSAWNYNPTNEAETCANPTSLGDALKYTYARVDKANKQIELVASKTSENSEEISSIQMNTSDILAKVESVEKIHNEEIGELNEEITTLTKKVEAQMTDEDIRFTIQSELSNGVDKVVTNTGYVFDDEGLTISKDTSEMSTQITDDGMVVYKNDEAMLTANNTGVYAQNLHATTYLIVGTHSRFEDYEKDGEPRTGCFWIGGN